MSPITHAKVSGKADGPDATLVRPSDWNADHEGESIGEGHIPIWPMLYSTMVSGSWGLLRDEQYQYDWYFRTATPANLDEVDYEVCLDAGTYTLVLMAFKSSGCGIVKAYLDADLIATFDLYAAGASYNNRLTDAGNVVSTAGLKTLKFKVDGKNASSSGYAFFWTQAGLYRTA